MKKALSLSFIGAALLVSCKKDQSQSASEDVFPQTFIARDRHILTNVKVYVKGGEVTDERILSAYLTEDFEDFFKGETGSMKAEPDTVIYLSADSVKVVLDGNSPMSNTPASDPVKSSQVYVIQHFEGKSFYTDSKNSPELLPVSESELKNDVRRFLTHKPLKLEQDPVFGQPYSFTYYYPFVVSKSENELKFPFVNLKFTQSRSFNGHISKNGIALMVNNEFNPVMLNTLEEGDTLAVQTSEVIFRRVK